MRYSAAVLALALSFGLLIGACDSGLTQPQSDMRGEAVQESNPSLSVPKNEVLRDAGPSGPFLQN